MQGGRRAARRGGRHGASKLAAHRTPTPNPRYTTHMVLPKTTLTDTLIEGGLNPDAAERTAEMIALGYDEVAKQPEVDRRLNEQDRLNDANFRRLETRIDAVETKIEAVEATLNAKIEALRARIDAVETTLAGKIAAVDTRVTDLREELNQRINDLDKSINRLYWLIGIIATANFALFGYIISRL